MKRLFSLFVIALPLVLVSCKPELDFVEGTLRPGTAAGSLSGGNISLDFTSTAGSASVDLKASGKWTASFVNDRARDWCSLSASEGKRGVATITVSVKENSDYDQRSASINFVCGDLKRTVVVTQKQKDALLLTTNRYSIGASGGVVSVEVKSNIPFKYTVSETARSWISFAGTKGLTSSVLMFSVAENDDVRGREGTISITSDAGNEIVTVSQEGTEPALVVGRDRYELTAAAQEISIDVQSNIDVTMELPSGCGWITESSTKSMSTNTFHLTVAENEEFVERSCRILFRSAEWNMEQEVTIVQQAAEPLIIIGTGLYQMEAAGGDLSVEVQSNLDVEMVIPSDCGWVHEIPTKALKTTVFNLSVDENESFADRSCQLLFRSSVLGIEEPVTIEQKAAEPQIIIGTGVYELDASGGDLSVEVTSNFGVTVEIPDTCAWIKAVGTKSMTTKTFGFTVEANTTHEERVGSILFHNESLGITESVKVVQSQKDAVIISEHLVNMPAEGGIVEVRVGHNIDYDVNIRPNWIKLVDTKSFTTDVLQFAVEPNTWVEPREGLIQFFSHAGTDTLIIRQDCEKKYVKVISPDPPVLSYEGGTLEVVLEHNSYGFRDGQAYFENEGNAVVGDNYLFNVGARRCIRDTPNQSRMIVPYTRNNLRRERHGTMYILDYHDYTKCIDSVVFTQPPAPILTSGDGVFLPREKSSFSFRVAVDSPDKVRVEYTASWIHALGNGVKDKETEFRWEADANPDGAMREAEIKVYLVEGGWPDVFHVRQEGSGLSVSVTYSASQTVKVPFIAGTFREYGTVNWGDGQTQAYTDGASHRYSSSGKHTVTFKSDRMQYIDWAEVSQFENGMRIDFSNIKGGK